MTILAPPYRVTSSFGGHEICNYGRGLRGEHTYIPINIDVHLDSHFK